jgi:CheY-like chemotaxis protein
MSKRILVVDDDADTRTMLRFHCESLGFEVSEAADGHEAVKVALRDQPDLVIMDMAMPMVDGVNSTRMMREHDTLRSVPIVALTGFGSFYRPRALKAGCTQVLTKPIDLETLQPILARHVGPQNPETN